MDYTLNINFDIIDWRNLDVIPLPTIRPIGYDWLIVNSTKNSEQSTQRYDLRQFNDSCRPIDLPEYFLIDLMHGRHPYKDCI